MPRWGKLDIGEGLGSAKSYNPMPIVQQYAQTLAENQAKHEQEVKMLGDQLAKGYDPSGLRNDADKQSYIQRYNQIKQDAINAENEKDNTKKALALSGIRQRLNDLSAFSQGSKKQGVFERQIALQHLNNPYLLDDNSATNLQSQLNKPWDDPSVIKDASGFERGVDPEKIETKYQKHRADVLKDSPVTYDNGVIGKPQDVGGKKLYTITQNRVIPFQDAYEHTLNFATADKDYQKYLHQKYPDIQTDTPQHTLALRVKQDMISRGDDKGFYDKPKTRDLEGRAPERWTKVQQWNIDHYGTPNAPNSTNTPNATAIIAENMRNSDPAKFTGLLKNTLPTKQWEKGKDLQVSSEVDANGQPLHVFKFPDKIQEVPKEKQANVTAEQRYNNHPEKKGSTLGFGGTPIPYKESKQYAKDVAAGRYFPNPVKVIKDNSQPYKIPTGDPQAYGVGVASMLKEQGASDAEINKILGRTGVNPVHLGQTPKQPQQQQNKPTTPSSMIRVKLPNGSMGEIPASRLKEFQKNYPGAEKID